MVLQIVRVPNTSTTKPVFILDVSDVKFRGKVAIDLFEDKEISVDKTVDIFVEEMAKVLKKNLRDRLRKVHSDRKAQVSRGPLKR